MGLRLVPQRLANFAFKVEMCRVLRRSKKGQKFASSDSLAG
jgi:hypothetical protein